MFYCQHFSPVFAGCLCSFWDQQFESSPTGSPGAAAAGLQCGGSVGMEHPTSLCWSIPRHRGRGAVAALGGSGALLGLCPARAGKQSRLSHRCEQCWPRASLPLTPHPAAPTPRSGRSPLPTLAPSRGSGTQLGQHTGRVWCTTCCAGPPRVGEPCWGRCPQSWPMPRCDEDAARGSAGRALRKAAAREPCRLLRAHQAAR